MPRLLKLLGLIMLALSLMTMPSHAAPIQSIDSGWKYRVSALEDSSISGFVFKAAVQPFYAEDWQPFNPPSAPPLDPDVKSIWVTVMLPEKLPYRHATFGYQTIEQASRVYIGNKLIYSDGDFGLPNQEFGLRSHLIELPHNAQGKQLSIQLYTDHPYRLGMIEHATVGEGPELVYAAFWNNAPNWVALPMSLLLLIIVIPCYQLLRNSRSFVLQLGLFLVNFCLWLLAGLNIIQVIYTFSPAFWNYIWLTSFYLLPIFFMLMAREALPDRRSHLMTVLIVICFIFFLTAIIGELTGRTFLDRFLEIYLLFSWMCLLCTAAILDLEANQGSEICSCLIIPSAVLPLLQIAQTICHIPLAPFAILPMMAVVLWLLRHALNERQRLRIQNQSLEERVEAAQLAAQIDSLTKCYNRGQLQVSLEKFTQEATDTGTPLSYLMLDLDHFKHINDTFGHDAGDQVLEGFAQLVRRHLDARHTFIRYGGEEFVLLCRGFDLENAADFADAIRADLFLSVLLLDQRITCSIGVSTWHGADDTPFGLQKRADQAVYLAKEQGRNRVITEESLPETDTEEN